MDWPIFLKKYTLKKYSAWGLLALLLTVALCEPLYSASYDSQISQQRKQLKKLKKELQDQRRKLKMVEIQEQGLNLSLIHI